MKKYKANRRNKKYLKDWEVKFRCPECREIVHYKGVHAYDCYRKNQRTCSNRCSKLGERNPMHKMTREEVLLLRKFYKTGQWTQRQLAEYFEISLTETNLIINYKRWGWLKD